MCAKPEVQDANLKSKTRMGSLSWVKVSAQRTLKILEAIAPAVDALGSYYFSVGNPIRFNDCKETYTSAIGHIRADLSAFLQDLKDVIRREKAYQYSFLAALAGGLPRLGHEALRRWSC